MKTKTLHGAAILGTALGDTLGAPFEFRMPPEIASQVAQIGWTWTDDTQQSLVLLDDFLRYGSLDYFRVMNRFKQYWLHPEFPNAHGCGLHRGTGSRFRAAVGSYVNDGVIAPCNTSGNGAAMRVAAVAYAMADTEYNLRAIRQVSACTHGENLGVAAAEAVTLMAWALRDGLRGDEALDAVASRIWEPRIAAQLRRVLGVSDWRTVIEASTGKPAGAAFALCGPMSAIVIAARSNSVYDAIVSAVMLGEDTDSTAAISGGLTAGAFGFEGIPEAWFAFPEAEALAAWDSESAPANPDLCLETEVRIAALRAGAA